MKPLSCFITGTDTEIGKTTVSCAIIRALVKKGLRVAAMKPVAAGAFEFENALHNEDVDALTEASNMDLPLSLTTPYLLKTPIAPHLSAEQDHVVIDNNHIVSCYREISHQADAVIVEGVGGFCVPFTDCTDSAELAVQLGLPVILVVGMKLGCINHALLTAEAVRSRGLELAGWVANTIDPHMPFCDENIHTLEARLNAPRLGTLPHLESFTDADTFLDLHCLTDWSL